MTETEGVMKLFYIFKLSIIIKNTHIEKISVVVSIQTCSGEVCGSNLGRFTSYPK
jgi:hypothetical protein